MAPQHTPAAQSRAPACLLVPFLSLLQPQLTPHCPLTRPPQGLCTHHSLAWDAGPSGCLPQVFAQMFASSSLCHISLYSVSGGPHCMIHSCVTCHHLPLQPLSPLHFLRLCHWPPVGYESNREVDSGHGSGHSVTWTRSCGSSQSLGLPAILLLSRPPPARPVQTWPPHTHCRCHLLQQLCPRCLLPGDLPPAVSPRPHQTYPSPSAALLTSARSCSAHRTLGSLGPSHAILTPNCAAASSQAVL